MKAFQIYKASYAGKFPKIIKIYAGRKGLEGGIALLWKNYLIPIILPVNERQRSNNNGR